MVANVPTLIAHFGAAFVTYQGALIVFAGQ